MLSLAGWPALNTAAKRGGEGKGQAGWMIGSSPLVPSARGCSLLVGEQSPPYLPFHPCSPQSRCHTLGCHPTAG